MPIENGRSIYAENIYESLVVDGVDREICLLPFKIFSTGNFFLLRILSALLLIPSMWIPSLSVRKQFLTTIREKTVDKQYSHIILDHMQLWWLIIPLKRRLPESRIVLVSHNLEFKAKWSYLKYGNIFLKIGALVEVIPIFIWEVVCAFISDAVISINSQEQKFYSIIKKTKASFLIYPFVKTGSEDSLNRNVGNNLVLVGSYRYKAKEQNALWLVNTVMPEIHKYNSSITLNLIGRGITGEMKQSCMGKAYINIVGEVEDLEPWYKSAFAVIIPEKMGGGFKLKTLEAVRYRRPILIHKNAAEGTVFQHNTDWLVFETAEELVVSLTMLYNNPKRRKQLVHHSFSQLCKYHTVGAARSNMKQVLKLA